MNRGLSRLGVEHRVRPAPVLIARLGAGARVEHGNLPGFVNQWHVGVAKTDQVISEGGKARQPDAARVDVLVVRLPGAGVDLQHPGAIELQVTGYRRGSQEVQRCGGKRGLALLEVRRVAPAEEHLFVITLNAQDARLLQDLHRFSAETILADRIPRAQQRVGGGHILKGTPERPGVGVDVGDDTDFHEKCCSGFSDGKQEVRCGRRIAYSRSSMP